MGGGIIDLYKFRRHINEYMRYKLNKGSEIEIYSKTENTWFDGIVKKGDGDLLTVQYVKIKKVERYGKSIRSIEEKRHEMRAKSEVIERKDEQKQKEKINKRL